ncbi:AAA family ATPase, partial [Mesorhizobium sp. WSM3882]|uniref:AAA family ATPase n=1 Tax=Mesorhizobium sp. WSM3882 TaxID=2029407 RepID=UPI000BCAA899
MDRTSDPTFGELLAWHLRRGTRPYGTAIGQGQRWSRQDFANSVRRDERAIRYWIRDKHLPTDIRAVELALFGDKETKYSEWRCALREAHARGLAARDVSGLRPSGSDREIEASESEFAYSASEDLAETRLAGAYGVIGTVASAASERTFEASKDRPFYGRSSDLDALNEALTKFDRGILLLRGEAGLGKTRLAAVWSEVISRSSGKIVLRHAFSVREPAAGSHAAMVENLVRQAASAVGPEALGPGEPGDASRLRDRLAALLATNQPVGRSIVVIIDGLDEAAESIEPMPTSLGRGVFVLATCRAERQEEPRVFRLWREQAWETKLLIFDRTLQPLDSEAITQWLAEVAGLNSPTDALVARAMRASEGLPLFASYLIPDAVATLVSGSGGPLPDSFGDYVLNRLTELQDRMALQSTGRWSWGDVLELFALLSVAKEPLPPSALRNLVGPHLLDELDQRAERWLWRRTDGEGGVSLAHPRLATVFVKLLPRFQQDIVINCEERLIEACFKAWNNPGREPLRRYALAFLPSHLIGLDRKDEAAFLLGDGGFLLGRLTASPTAATVRTTASETIELGFAFGDGHPVSAWRRFWSETETSVLVGIGHGQALGLTAASLLFQLARDRFGAGSPAFQSLATASTKVPRGGMRLASPTGFGHPSLLRSMDRAHENLFEGGVLALANRLVSWGFDGAIRFWSLQGEACSGGDAEAHAHGVRGVLPLANSLVSWGGDGAIRFWSLQGEVSLGGDLKAHKNGVGGVLALTDRLVSWSSDGAIRFWNFEGEPCSGGDAEAHRRGVGGLLALTDRLVSWGCDGEICVWSPAGEPHLRAGAKADQEFHGFSGDELVGMLAISDRLVSWNLKGAICFWSLDGQPLPGGDLNAHEGAVGGMLGLADGLVSWGWDGAIRFWSLDGQRRPGGDPKAHRGLVVGVLELTDGLVSWGVDGAIRLWSLDGQPRPGGDPKAHRDVVGGVLALTDRLVSWGGLKDGAIRFWSVDGHPKTEGDPVAHLGGVRGVMSLGCDLVSYGFQGGIRLWRFGSSPDHIASAYGSQVLGVLALADRLVSWNSDGAIRFWDFDGGAHPIGDVQAHKDRVTGVLALADGLVSWGEDGAIRFWSLDGQRRPGGDPKAHRGPVAGMLELTDGLVSWG